MKARAAKLATNDLARLSSSQAGFTLIEILVAVAIFGLLSIGAYSVLDAGMRSRVHMEQRLADLEKVQRAVAKLERDIQLLVPRLVRNEFGDTQALLVAESDLSGQVARMAFTRGDWRNPAQLPRPNLQHVMYQFDNGSLKRGHRLFLDSTTDSVTVVTELLDNVEQFQLGFLTTDNQWLSAWGLFAQEEQLVQLPVMIRFELVVQPFGKITRLIPVPQAALSQQSSERDTTVQEIQNQSVDFGNGGADD